MKALGEREEQTAMVLLKNLEEEMEEKRAKEKARIEEENKAKEEAAGMEKLDVMKMVERAMKSRRLS
ncbi:unnamed protein product [Boreogadus saida]